MCATSIGDKVLLAAALVDQQKRTLVRVRDGCGGGGGAAGNVVMVVAVVFVMWC
jgi:hypothetical protein